MIGTDLGVTPSGLVYLFGEQFVGPARLIGETLLYSRVKVKARELAEAIYAAALVALDGDGAVRLELAQRKRLLGLARVQRVAVTRLGAAPAGSLEGAILAQLDADPAKNDVPDLLYRQLGEEMIDPWAHLTAAVKADLVARGFLHEEREARSGLGKVLGDKVTLSALPERIAPLTGQAGLVNEMLAGFRARQPQLATQLWKDLRAGFQSRQEKQDSGTDD